MTSNEIVIVITRAARAMGVPPDRLMEKGKVDKPTTAARRLAFYYMHYCGHSFEGIAKTFRMGEDTVKRGIYHVKHRLDNYRAELAAIDGRES